jgi:hypothetical protein
MMIVRRRQPCSRPHAVGHRHGVLPRETMITYPNCSYLLGGKDNFAADRAAGDAVLAAYPGIVASVRANRAFLARSATALRSSCSTGVAMALS